LIFRVKLLKLS